MRIQHRVHIARIHFRDGVCFGFVVFCVCQSQTDNPEMPEPRIIHLHVISFFKRYGFIWKQKKIKSIFIETNCVIHTQTPARPKIK